MISNNISHIARRLKKTITNYNRKKIWENIYKRRNDLVAVSGLDLTQEEIKEIHTYWAKYGVKINPIFHKFYKRSRGSFDLNIIPDDIYYIYIDTYFNNWQAANILDNKTYYQWLFKDIPQPETIVYRQNSFWYDEAGNLISLEKALKKIKEMEVAFIKKATDSEGGSGVKRITKKTDSEIILSYLTQIKNDLVVQKGMVQSPILSQFNETSVNTIRILTLLRKDGSVKICSTSLRMGVNGSYVDNASRGGVTVGVQEDGSLNKIGYNANGEKFEEHPTSKVKWGGVKLPNYEMVKSLVIESAKRYPISRLISWDIALDEKNLPVMIEANLKYGQLDFHQLNNGPIFGEETVEILSEVFSK